MFYRSTISVSLLTLIFVAIFSETGLAQSTPGYSITKTVALGAPDHWDSVIFDPTSHRVFVAHGDRLTIVDGHDGTTIGQVEGFPGGTHGIAISTTTGHGYSDDGKAGTVGSFDLATLKRLSTIKAAADADGIVFDPSSGHVFVINGDSGSVTVIDPASDSAITTVSVGGELEFATVDDRGKLYINGAEKREIVRMDTVTNQVDAHWPVPNCERPHGIAIDLSAHRLFSSCVNNVLVVVNTDSGAMVATLPIGSRTDGAGFDPKRKLVFSSNGDGTLSVIAERGPDNYVSLATIQTLWGARTMAIDPDSGRIYLVTADFTVNASANPSDFRHHYVVTPGSAKLLFLDPAF